SPSAGTPTVWAFASGWRWPARTCWAITAPSGRSRRCSSSTAAATSCDGWSGTWTRKRSKASPPNCSGRSRSLATPRRPSRRAALPSLPAQRLDGIEPRRAHGRQEAERDAHGRAEQQADHRPLQRDLGVEVREHGDEVAQPEAGDDPDHSADVAQHDRLEQELEQDALRARAERLADADLARPLRHRHQHDVHDADAGHDQGDGADDEGADLDAETDLVELGDQALAVEELEV